MYCRSTGVMVALVPDPDATALQVVPGKMCFHVTGRGVLGSLSLLGKWNTVCDTENLYF